MQGAYKEHINILQDLDVSPVEIRNKNDLQNISFLKLYDDDIIKYIKDVLKEEINKGNIIECDVDLTSFVIYKVFVTVLFEYGEEINEEKVAKEITSILKNGLIK